MQERSIPDQQAYVEKWAKEHGYTIKRWYIDDAISGTSAKDRESFERMIREAENGRDFDTVLCYDMSRFSRGGTNETGYFLHRLKMAGVEVVFPAEGIPEGDEGELLQGVKSWQARQYSVKLSRDTIRGQISNIVERHCAPGGAPPFGYDHQHTTASGQVLRTFRFLSDGRKEEYSPEGRLVRVLPPGESFKKTRSDLLRYVPSTPERVAIVKRIFEQSAKGYGSMHIAYRLNADGVASPYGKYWQSNQIRKMLRNPAYRGAVAWNRRTMAKLHGVGADGRLRPKRTAGGCQHNPQEDWFVVENVHEPLVPPELWEKAHQAYMSRRGQGGGAKSTPNRSLLSGLIVCRHCGQRFGQHFTSKTYRGQRARHRYYVDRGYHVSGRAVCRPTSISADALDRFVVGKIRNLLMADQETTSKAADIFVKRAVASRKPTEDTTAVQRDMDAVTKRIKTTLAMLADPSFDGMEELKTTLAELKAKRDVLLSRLDRSKPAAAPPAESDLRSWVTEQIGGIDEVLDGRASIVEARRLVHSCVDRIEIDPEVCRGYLYLPSDAYGIFARETSTRGNLGDSQGRGTAVSLPAPHQASVSGGMLRTWISRCGNGMLMPASWKAWRMAICSSFLTFLHVGQSFTNARNSKLSELSPKLTNSHSGGGFLSTSGCSRAVLTSRSSTCRASAS
jgi:DNA invertase Pin-like site-specific DNA recombinase